MDVFTKIVLAVACLSALVAAENIADPIVQLPNGKIRGRDNGYYLSFESIPYAEPPTGVNRFEAPKPYTATWSGIRDATLPPPKCIQWDQYLFREDLLDGQEDCLNINVFTPSITDNRTYPVIVIIHGGAFMFGTSAENNDPDYLMESGNVILVKMNYRLGPMGFLSTEDDMISGNFGLKDQLLAIEWTKQNIAAFNGNPEKISVIGFSAGGSSVHLQMLNKRLEKLATSAMSLSGTAFCPWVIMRNPLKRTAALAGHLNCSTEDTRAIRDCLKKKDAGDIVRAVRHFQVFGYNPFTIFGPVIEGKTVENAFLSEEPEDVIKNGRSAEIPWLASCSKDDGGYNAGELMRKDANGKELIESLNEHWNEMAPVNLFFEHTIEKDLQESYSKELRRKYMGEERFSAKTYKKLQKMYTDVLFASGVEKALKLHKQYTKSPVYAYVFDYPSGYGIGNVISQRFDYNFGTVHGDDYYLFFGTPVRTSDMFSPTERALSKKFINMLEDFSQTGHLHFGDCKFLDNKSSTNGLLVMQIRNDSCDTANVETLL